MPVHRVPGGLRRAVFAYPDELDRWLVSENGIAASALPFETPAEHGHRSPTRSVLAGALATAALGLTAAALWWRSAAQPAIASVAIAPSGIHAIDRDGHQQWAYTLPIDWRAGVGRANGDIVDVGSDGELDVVAGLAYTQHVPDHAYQGGQLFCFSRFGGLRWTHLLLTSLRFGGVDYGGPWVLSEWRVKPDGSRVAVAYHHLQWWPSVVVFLDARGRPTGRFVNSGWVESIKWLTDGSSRVAVAGFSNSRDGGMLALLDPSADAQSPEDESGKYACSRCAAGRPFFYAVFPRSEVNRETGAPPNRASIEILSDRLVVRTSEVPVEANAVLPPPELLYELTFDFEFRRAEHSDRYWALHRQLERDRRIAHPVDRCPERTGPRSIAIWRAATGWRTQTPN